MSDRRIIICRGFGSGEPCADFGKLLEAYNPEVDTRHCATWTADPDKARVFENAQAAFKLYSTVSKTHPRRLSDGQPNKPLTGYHVEIAPADRIGR